MTRARILADYVAGGTTAAEFDYLDGVTSNVQTQLDNKPSRNLIINGGMQVWQRATSATAAGVNTYNTADRWMFAESADGGFTSERHSMSEAELNTTGHFYALKLVCTGVDSSVAAGAHSTFMQNIEAQNLQHLQYGTASAKTITLSFWVKSNKTGTYCVAIEKPDTTAYRIPIEYSISSADTWEQKKITITPTAGSTSLITGSGGVINNDNGLGLGIRFSLVMGSTYQGTNNTWSTSNVLATSNQVNWQDSTSNNFYITGLQLEVGSNATTFEHQSYGDELARCERYYQKSDGDDFRALGYNVKNTDNKRVLYSVDFRTEFRASPTIVTSDGGTANAVYLDNWGVGNTGSITSATPTWITKKHFTVGMSSTSTSNEPHNLCRQGWTASAELS